MIRPALVLALVLAVTPVAAQVAGADAAADSFYKAWLTPPRSNGIPSPAARARLAPLFSARLAQLIGQAAAADARFRSANRFAPSLMEGDLFSSLLDGPASYRIGACTGTATTQRCRIQFHRPPEPKSSGPVRPADWGDDLLLVNEGGGWKVDDVDYRGGFAYGNTGLLSQALAMVIKAAS
jgi:hypothetical protein